MRQSWPDYEKESTSGPRMRANVSEWSMRGEIYMLFLRSGDTTLCQITPVILRRVVSPDRSDFTQDCIPNTEECERVPSRVVSESTSGPTMRASVSARTMQGEIKIFFLQRVFRCCLYRGALYFVSTKIYKLSLERERVPSRVVSESSSGPRVASHMVEAAPSTYPAQAPPSIVLPTIMPAI